jgi:hypothetical protein
MRFSVGVAPIGSPNSTTPSYRHSPANSVTGAFADAVAAATSRPVQAIAVAASHLFIEGWIPPIRVSNPSK